MILANVAVQRIAEAVMHSPSHGVEIAEERKFHRTHRNTVYR